MDKLQLINKLRQVKDINKDYKLIYEVLDALGIQYRKTSCHKCRWDLYNIAREELNMIEDASVESEFNSDEEYDYIYLLRYPVRWMDAESGNSYIMKQSTPRHIIEKFVKTHSGYYSKQLKIK